MGEKYGLTKDQGMTEIVECASYEEAVRTAARGEHLVVFFAHGQWWF